MNELILLLGGNIGDTVSYLKEAKTCIEKSIGEIEKTSALYESEPWGFDSQQNFLNQALVVKTLFDPNQVLSEIHKIEANLGRVRDNSGEYKARTVDIDIIFYNDLISINPDLIIPHKSLQERRFALLPISEIAPDKMHPKLGKTVLTLLDDCNDESIVTKVI